MDELDVVTLAVLGNPDLKAARLRAGVAQAQLVQAGLIPDPTFDASLGRSSSHTGYAVGLNEDLQPLFTRDARVAAARAHVSAVHLEILWDEWQVAERASELFSVAQADDALAPILKSQSALLEERYRVAQAALARGNATMSAVSSELVALADVQDRLRRLDLDANRARHELNALLGLAPEAKLMLRGEATPPLLVRPAFASALATMPKRRPDLLALEAGYRSSEARLREAILGEFPPLTVGVEQGRSTEEGVSSVGLSLNVTLPFFNGNRGAVAIGEATRAALRQEYQARLDQSESDADRVWHATRILSRELATLNARLPALQSAADAAKQAFAKGTLDIDSYTSLTTYALTEQADAIRLAASLAAAQASLRMLLGLPFEGPP